jgi:hypothetical protein
VRCAAVLDFAPEEVWATVTDYDHFTEIFPTVAESQVTAAGEGRFRHTGVAITALGNWPFEIDVRNERDGETYRSSWEGAKGDVTLIRGGWTMTPAGAGKTLLVYTSEVEIKKYPNFIVRNLLLLRQPQVLRAVGAWLEKKHVQP